MSIINVLVTIWVSQAAMTFAADDRGFCGHRIRTRDLYQDYVIDMVAINIRGSGEMDDILVIDHSGLVPLKVYKLEQAGFLHGGTELIPSGPPFCVPSGGTLYTADINGDGRDDLICKESDGSITFRLFSNNNFLPSKAMSNGFSCTTGDLHIGDFDGNNAADLLCINSGGDASTIYFNQACNNGGQSLHFSPFRNNPYSSCSQNNNYRAHSGFGQRHNFRSIQNLPVTSTLNSDFSPCGPTDTIYIGDVDGNKRSDIICHSLTGDISFVLSTGKASGTIFSASPVVNTAATGCPSTLHGLVLADIDGDGDDDLACIEIDASSSFRHVPVSYSTGAGFPAFIEYPTNSPNNVCAIFCGMPGFSGTKFSAGDFNGDGFDDLICRMDFIGAARTEISFSQAYPAA